MPFNNYPYTNLNDLNLDRILKLAEEARNLNENVYDYIRENLDEVTIQALFDDTTGLLFLNGNDSVPTAGADMKGVRLGNVVHNIKIPDTGENIVFFGDSWTYGTGADPQGNRFSTLLANKLGKTEFNFGVGAAGFSIPGNLIRTQIDTAENNMTDEERDKTGYVVITGGVNDWRHRNDYNISMNAWISAISNVVRRAYAIFPNSVVVVVLCNTQAYYFNDVWARWITQAQRTIRRIETKLPMIVVQNAAESVNFNPSCWTSDELHINTLGHSVFAAHIYSSIMGGGTDVNYYFGVPAMGTDVTVDVDPHLFRKNDFMTLNATRWSFPAVAAGKQKTLAILKSADAQQIAPRFNQYMIACLDNIVVGTVCITPSGNIVFTNSSGESINGCWTPYTEWRLDRTE